jgi:hypothetical protein
MAYFPNGTAGACYEGEYCANCIHDRGEGGCAILLIHNLFNYDQCDDNDRGKAIKSILEILIPSTVDGLGAEQCALFAPIADPEAEAAEQRRLAEQPRKYQAVMAEMERAA